MTPTRSGSSRARSSARVLQRQAGGGDGELGEAVEAPGAALLDVVVRHESRGPAAAIRLRKGVGSNRVIVPDRRPARRSPAHNPSTPVPIGRDGADAR